MIKKAPKRVFFIVDVIKYVKNQQYFNNIMQTTVDIRELQERIERESSFVDALTMGMNQVIVGQKHLVESQIGRAHV